MGDQSTCTVYDACQKPRVWREPRLVKIRDEISRMEDVISPDPHTAPVLHVMRLPTLINPLSSQSSLSALTRHYRFSAMTKTAYAPFAISNFNDSVC